MIGFAIVLPLLPFYAENLAGDAQDHRRGSSPSFSIAQLISAPLWGRVSDRYGRRPALLIGLSASAVAYVVFGLANTVAWLFLSRIIQGAGGGTTGVAQAYVADSIPAAGRARALGLALGGHLARRDDRSGGRVAGRPLGPGGAGVRGGGALPGQRRLRLALPAREPARRASTPPTRKPVWHAAWQVFRSPGTTGRPADLDLRASGCSPSPA